MERLKVSIQHLLPPSGLQKRCTVLVVGAGNAGHVLSALLGSTGLHHVRMLVLKHEVKAFGKRVTLNYEQRGAHLKSWVGTVDAVSDKPKRVVPGADYIILCMPVGKQREALRAIAPWVDEREVTIGTVYGQAGFNWMIDEFKARYRRPRTVGFAIGLIPWICRVKQFGAVGTTYGCKDVNIVALTDPEHFHRLDQNLLQYMSLIPFGKGRFRLSPNFLSLTLSVDNQIIHPARCYGLYSACGGQWKTEDEVPFFYRDFDVLSADILRGLDQDYSAIRQVIRTRFLSLRFPYMLDYLALERVSIGTHSTDIRKSFTDSVQLRDIKPPLVKNETGEGWSLNTKHRFFHDDIQYGLCIAKWFADQLDVEVPTIDRVLIWAQSVKKERLIEGGRLVVGSPDLTRDLYSGVPFVYGFTSVEQTLG